MLWYVQSPQILCGFLKRSPDLNRQR